MVTNGEAYARLISQLKEGSTAHTPELLAQLRKVCLDLTIEVTERHVADEQLTSELDSLLRVLRHGLSHVPALSDLRVPDAMPVQVRYPKTMQSTYPIYLNVDGCSHLYPVSLRGRHTCNMEQYTFPQDRGTMKSTQVVDYIARPRACS
jgi:hypothetical protein